MRQRRAGAVKGVTVGRSEVDAAHTAHSSNSRDTQSTLHIDRSSALLTIARSSIAASTMSPSAS
jgi:hypothetical protein